MGRKKESKEPKESWIKASGLSNTSVPMTAEQKRKLQIAAGITGESLAGFAARVIEAACDAVIAEFRKPTKAGE